MVPEVSTLPSNKGQPLRTDLDSTLSRELEANWGSSHTATRLRTMWLEEAGEVGLSTQETSSKPRHPAASWLAHCDC